MREFGLQLAADMQKQDGNGAQAGGARVEEEEVLSFWEALGVPSQAGRISDYN